MRHLRARFGVVLVAGVAIGVVACGSRGPLDIGDDYQLGADAAIATDAASVPPPESDASMSPDAEPTADAGPVRRDAGFAFDSGVPLVNCGVCIAQSCGQGLFQCITDTGCRTTLQCVAQTCLAGGGGMPSPQCLFTCGKADPQAIPQILDVLTCVLTSCGQDCTSVLMGGGGPGGGRVDGG